MRPETMPKEIYAPGCALMLYKPGLAEKITAFLNRNETPAAAHPICCRHEPGLERGTRVIKTCAGCDKRFRTLYEGISTISLWEVLAADDTFPFPDYGGVEMTVHDACPTRTEVRVHKAVRELLRRMNIAAVEAERAGTKAVCCGDSFHGSLPPEKVKERMRQRARSMPCEDVVVYCVSCVKAMYIGGKKPRYLVDLLFGETTEAGEFEPELWHGLLEKYIETH